MDRFKKLQNDRRYPNGEKSYKEELFEIINEMPPDKQEGRCENILYGLRIGKMSEDDFNNMVYQRLPFNLSDRLKGLNMQFVEL